jgi:dienelactone hydrolase
VIVLAEERFKLCVLDFLNKSWIGSAAKPGRPLPPYRSERVWFPTDFGAGTPAPAVLLVPTKEVRRPGVLVVPEAFGLTTTLLDAGIRFARAGFEVLLPDVGKTPGLSFADGFRLRTLPRARGGVSLDSDRLRKWIGLYVDALRFLRGRPLVDPDRCGVFGVASGAALAIGLAAEDRKLSAIAVVSPVPIRPPEYVRAVTAPLLAVVGERDRRAAGAARAWGGSASGTGTPSVEITTLPAVGPTFLSRDLRGYDLPAAERAWTTVVEFLRSRLFPPPPKPPPPPKIVPPPVAAAPPSTAPAAKPAAPAPPVPARPATGA